MTVSLNSVDEDLRHAGQNLSKPARETLVRMYSAGVLDGTEEKNRSIGVERISIIQGSELNRLLREIGAKKTLEIGFAYGYSTIWIIDAVAKLDEGFHIAVDPFEKSDWGGVGIQQVRLTDGFERKFEWQEAYSIHALSDFIRRNEKFDGIFIDGNHRFDDVLVDFYLADQCLGVGGVIAFDDMWMDSVKSVVSFISTNRSYKLLSQQARNMTAFTKLGDDNRHWQHYEPFKTRHSSTWRRLKKTIRQLTNRVTTTP